MPDLPEYDGDRAAWLEALAALPVDELADAIETDRAALAEVKREAKRREKEIQDRIAGCTAVLESRLGFGEVAQAASTGRVAIKTTVSGGNASVNEKAFADLNLIGRLPEYLQPRPSIVLPGVTAIREAEAELKALGIDVHALLIERAPVPGIRWRTLSEWKKDR